MRIYYYTYHQSSALDSAVRDTNACWSQNNALLSSCPSCFKVAHISRIHMKLNGSKRRAAMVSCEEDIKYAFKKSSCCLPVRGFFNSVNAESYRASKGESAVSKENRQVQPARTAKQHACIVQVSRDAAEKYPHAILVRASCRKTILLLANTCMIDLQWRSC